jgi:hypothetical protein
LLVEAAGKGVEGSHQLAVADDLRGDTHRLVPLIAKLCMKNKHLQLKRQGSTAPDRRRAPGQWQGSRCYRWPPKPIMFRQP